MSLERLVFISLFMGITSRVTYADNDTLPTKSSTISANEQHELILAADIQTTGQQPLTHVTLRLSSDGFGPLREALRAPEHWPSDLKVPMGTCGLKLLISHLPEIDAKQLLEATLEDDEKKNSVIRVGVHHSISASERQLIAEAILKKITNAGSQTGASLTITVGSDAWNLYDAPIPTDLSVTTKRLFGFRNYLTNKILPVFIPRTPNSYLLVISEDELVTQGMPKNIDTDTLVISGDALSSPVRISKTKDGYYVVSMTELASTVGSPKLGTISAAKIHAELRLDTVLFSNSSTTIPTYHQSEDVALKGVKYLGDQIDSSSMLAPTISGPLEEATISKTLAVCNQVLPGPCAGVPLLGKLATVAAPLINLGSPDHGMLPGTIRSGPCAGDEWFVAATSDAFADDRSLKPSASVYTVVCIKGQDPDVHTMELEKYLPKCDSSKRASIAESLRVISVPDAKVPFPPGDAAKNGISSEMLKKDQWKVISLAAIRCLPEPRMFAVQFGTLGN